MTTGGPTDLDAPVNSTSGRLAYVDALRFVAAIGVMAAHYTLPTTRAAIASGIDQHLIGAVAKYGYLGVHLFFVISGFVIFQTARNTDPIGFFAGRFARIFPTFSVCALISLLVVSLAGLREPSIWLYLANLTFEPHLFGFDYIDGSYWTLRYEMQFYGFVFILLLFGSFDRLILPVSIVWLIIAAISTAGLMPKVLRWIFIADYAPLFIVGIGLFAWRQFRSPAAACIVIGATGLAVVNELLHLRLTDATGEVWNRWIIGAGVILIVPVLLLATGTHRCKCTAVLYFLGGISFPVYLLHQELGSAMLTLPIDIVHGAPLAAIAATVGMSSVVFVVDDRHRGAVRRGLDAVIRRLLIPCGATRGSQALR